MSAEGAAKVHPDPPPDIRTKHLVRAPGPGKYFVKETALTSDFAAGKKGAFRWSMAGKPRQREKASESTPGPGNYFKAPEKLTTLGGTKHTMAARFVVRDKDYSVPPPSDGKAVIKPQLKNYMGLGPKFTMSGRLRPLRGDQPGEAKAGAAKVVFDPLKALGFVQRKAPSFSMGGKPRTIEGRDPYRPDDSMMPPSGKAVIKQEVKSMLAGPKYSMTGRTPRPREQVLPGPGAYDKANMHINVTGKQGGPSYSMSARTTKGIQYGHWGDEPRLTERLPPVVNPAVVHSR